MEENIYNKKKQDYIHIKSLKILINLLCILQNKNYYNEDGYIKKEDIVNILKEEGINISNRNLIRYLNSIERELSDIYYIERNKKGIKLTTNSIDKILNSNRNIENIKILLETPLGGIVDQNNNDFNDIRTIYSYLIDIRNPENKKMLAEIFSAMKEKRCLTIDYQSNNKKKTSNIFPIKLYNDYYGVFLLYFNIDINEYRLIILNRITHIQRYSKKLTEKKINEIYDYINSAWGKMIDGSKIYDVEILILDENIKVHFEKSPLHKTQKIECVDNKCILKIKIHNLKEFSRFILRYGAGLKIIGPDELIEETKKYLSNMVEMYK